MDGMLTRVQNSRFRLRFQFSRASTTLDRSPVYWKKPWPVHIPAAAPTFARPIHRVVHHIVGAIRSALLPRSRLTARPASEATDHTAPSVRPVTPPSIMKSSTVSLS